METLDINITGVLINAVRKALNSRSFEYGHLKDLRDHAIGVKKLYEEFLNSLDNVNNPNGDSEKGLMLDIAILNLLNELFGIFNVKYVYTFVKEDGKVYQFKDEAFSGNIVSKGSKFTSSLDLMKEIVIKNKRKGEIKNNLYNTYDSILKEFSSSNYNGQHGYKVKKEDNGKSVTMVMMPRNKGVISEAYGSFFYYIKDTKLELINNMFNSNDYSADGANRTTFTYHEKLGVVAVDTLRGRYWGDTESGKIAYGIKASDSSLPGRVQFIELCDIIINALSEEGEITKKLSKNFMKALELSIIKDTTNNISKLASEMMEEVINNNLNKI